MKYLIIGAGGTGGAIAGYMGRAGKDITVIARGEHLQAIRERHGLKIIRPEDEFFAPVRAFDMEHYSETPDVIFACVKEYSLDEAVTFIRKIADSHTIVIPVLNIFGTGLKMQKELPDMLVTDGCIYVASQKKEPGVILMSGMILRVVFGVRRPEDYRPSLEQIKKDLDENGIRGILSKNIRADALLKFSYVSPQGACGLYYNIPAGPMQSEGIYRETFANLVHEIDVLADAMGIHFGEDIVRRNLAILDDLAPDMTTSLQKDIAAGHDSEIDGLIYNVPDMARKYQVILPEYEKIASALKGRIARAVQQRSNP